MKGKKFVVCLIVMLFIGLINVSNITSSQEETTFVFDFVEGWNSVTIPLEVENNTFGFLFGDVFYNGTDGYIEPTLFYWNNTKGWFEYLLKDARLCTGIGYYIYSYENFSHSITGTPISEELSINLLQRDNLVGWIHETTVTAEDVYNLIQGCVGVSKYSSPSNTDYLTYTPEEPENNFDITQGMGFWISVTQSSVWDGSVSEEEPLIQLYIDSPNKISEEDYFTVIVYRQESGMKDVTVTFNQETYTTNSNGEVILHAPSVDKNLYFTLNASKQGYLSDEKQILVKNIDASSNQNNTEKQLIISTDNSIYESTGFVVTVTYDQNPVNEVVISFNNKTSFTDGSGQVILTAPSIEKNSSYQIKASKEGYLSDEKWVDVININNTETSPSNGSTYGHSELIEEAIKNNKVGGELTIQLDENEVNYTKKVVIYNDNDVTIDSVKISKDDISLVVNGDGQSGGKTIIINLGEGVFESFENLVIEYDSELIKMADNIDDVLNPDDDGSHPEYLITGTQILISIPHFSEHTINIYSKLAEITGTVMKYKEYAIAFAMIIIVLLGVIVIMKEREGY
jgi:hypothetical protein